MIQSSKPAGLAELRDSLLVLIDFQEKLLPVMSDKDRALENAVRLAKFAKVVKMPVILSEQEKLGPTVPELAAETEGCQVFGKITFDCFAEEAFRAHVGLTEKKTLILAGIEAHICVLQTALSALGTYTVHVVSDAVSSRSPHNCEAALARFRQSGVIATTTEMVIYELLRRAGTPEFKDVLKLVK